MIDVVWRRARLAALVVVPLGCEGPLVSRNVADGSVSSGPDRAVGSDAGGGAVDGGSTAAATITFSLNTQDFSYPDLSKELVERVLDLHDAHGLPLDVYLTTTQVDLFASRYPQIIERLKRSALVAMSYHVRPPTPYHDQTRWWDWRSLSEAERTAAILNCETHGLDPVTGAATAAPGGYGYLAELMGYAPFSVGTGTAPGPLGTTVEQVFARLGATFFVVHNRTNNVGDRRDGRLIRPEQVGLKLFEHVGSDPVPVLESAIASAITASGARAPYIVAVKMHDNDFFAEDSAFTRVYLPPPRTPPFDIGQKSALLAQPDRDAMWTLYRTTVEYVASQRHRLTVVNSRGLLALDP